MDPTGSPPCLGQVRQSYSVLITEPSPPHGDSETEQSAAANAARPAPASGGTHPGPAHPGSAQPEEPTQPDGPTHPDGATHPDVPTHPDGPTQPDGPTLEDGPVNESGRDAPKMAAGMFLQRPHLSRSTQKDTVVDVDHYMEKENDQLKMVTNRLMDDMDHLTKENEQLRKELDTLRGRRETWVSRIAKLESDNKKLQKEVQQRITRLQEESDRKGDVNDELQEKNMLQAQRLEQIQNDMRLKERDLVTKAQEIGKLKEKLDLAHRRNFDDRRFELLHEVDLLKTQKKDLCMERETLAKDNKKLTDEVKSLTSKLDERVSELKNENRRHSLLTKEFNSLLEENNRLKQQLRRRTSLNIQINSELRGSGEKLMESSATAARPTISWNSTRKIGRIGRHRAEKPNVEVTVGLGPMPPDASDFPGGIPALQRRATSFPVGRRVGLSLESKHLRSHLEGLPCLPSNRNWRP